MSAVTAEITGASAMTDVDGYPMFTRPASGVGTDVDTRAEKTQQMADDVSRIDSNESCRGERITT